jgi:hypothetical protein
MIVKRTQKNVKDPQSVRTEAPPIQVDKFPKLSDAKYSKIGMVLGTECGHTAALGAVAPSMHVM